jgi:hypothetical protein
MKEIKIVVNQAFGFHKEVIGHLPERWEEVTQPQLIAIAGMYMHEQTQTAMLAQLSGINEKYIKQFTDFELFNILHDLYFMTDYRPRNCFIIQYINKLIAPKYKLDGLTWEQFIFVDTYFHEYMGDANDEILNKFVAHLYLQKNEIFSHSVCMNRTASKTITAIPHVTKVAVTINYRLIYEWICSIYPLVFRKSGVNKQETSQKFNPGWIRIHESIVGDVLLNYEKYGQLQAHNVLRFISNKIKDNARKRK